MRTTKIRSFQKSLITIPNQIVANKPIENFSRRGIRRIKMRIGLTYDTSGEQVSKIVEEIKFMLHSHEGISHKDTLLVNFESFGDSALNIFIYTFTSTANWEKYLDIREDVHLQIMQIVELGKERLCERPGDVALVAHAAHHRPDSGRLST